MDDEFLRSKFVSSLSSGRLNPRCPFKAYSSALLIYFWQLRGFRNSDTDLLHGFFISLSMLTTWIRLAESHDYSRSKSHIKLNCIRTPYECQTSRRTTLSKFPSAEDLFMQKADTYRPESRMPSRVIPSALLVADLETRLMETDCFAIRLRSEVTMRAVDESIP